MKKTSNSEDVKHEIFEVLYEDGRYRGILNDVVDCMKKGQGPIVIESFATFLRRTNPESEVYGTLFTKKDINILKKHWNLKDGIEVQVSLNAELQKPFQEAKVSIKIPSEKYSIKLRLTESDEMMKQMVYFGHRDKNYFSLFFKTLGYSVKEGNLGDKYGLLISFGE